jgi:uncharacterized protein (TIGR02453 family)
MPTLKPVPSRATSSATSSIAFAGFTPAASKFFKELADNQNATWFAEHKADYEQLVKAPMTALVEAVTQRLASSSLPLCGDAKRSVFRINRDIRFSTDKSLYKTNASAVLSRDGSKTSPGLLYFQFGATEVFAASGFYMPRPDTLQLLRGGMSWRAKEWLAVREGLRKRGLHLMTEGALVRVPKGFESAPAELHDDLRLKSWAVRQDVLIKVARSPELVEVLAQLALASADMLEFGWTAIEAA